MRTFLCLPDTLRNLRRTHVESLSPDSGKRGMAVVYVANSFSAVIAIWRPVEWDVVITDGIGPSVRRQFEADLEHLANTEATSSPVIANTFLTAPDVRIPLIEGRYLIEGVAGEPAYATVAGFGLQGTYVSIATTIAGPDTRRTANRAAFQGALAQAWEEHLEMSAVALPTTTLTRVLGFGAPKPRTDLEEWRELVRKAVTE